MSNPLYYTEPPQPIFDEMKARCIEVWQETETNDSEEVSDKVSHLERIANIRDNFMFMPAMFDYLNRARLLNKLSDSCKKAFYARYTPPPTHDQHTHQSSLVLGDARLPI